MTPYCPICAKPGAVRYAQCRDDAHGVPGTWDIRWCEPCETSWLDPQPTALASLYPEGYPTHHAPFDVLDGGPGAIGALRRELKWEVLRRAYGFPLKGTATWLAPVGAVLSWLPPIRRMILLNTTRRLVQPAGRLLDVGCGNGSFLLTMRRLGWTVEGIEADPAAAQQARSVGLTVREGPVASIELEDGAYDAITVHHVLEHLPEPAKVLEKLARALRSGGVLVINVPNPVGALARYFGPAWRELDVPRHLFLPGPAALRRMLRACDLDVTLTTPTRYVTWIARESFSNPQAPKFSRFRQRLVRAWLRILALRANGGEEIMATGRKRRG